MFPHPTSDVGYNLMAILELDFKLSAWKGLSYYSRKLYNFLLCYHEI